MELVRRVLGWRLTCLMPFKHRHIFIFIGDATVSFSLHLHLSLLIRNKDIIFTLRLQADQAYRQQRYSTFNHRINEQDQKGNRQLDVVHPQHIDTHTLTPIPALVQRHIVRHALFLGSTSSTREVFTLIKSFPLTGVYVNCRWWLSCC